MFEDSTTFVSSSFPKHAKYKPSGVDWMGEVPEHWETPRLFDVLALTKRTGAPHLPLLSIYLHLGVVRFDEVDERRTNATSDDLSGYQVVEQNEFVANNQQAWRGSVGVSRHNGIISPAYLVFKCTGNYHPGYLNYLMRSEASRGQFEVCSKGIGSIQRNLQWSLLKSQRTLLPALSEQIQIVNFLDSKTQEIEEAIKQKQRTIELLEEYKHSLIEQAVTKGLDPSVPMKDSGVDWLGEVPHSWAIKPLRNSFSERRETVSALDFTPLSVSKAGVTMQLESAVKSADPSNRKLVRKGDFAINSRSDRKGSSGTSELTGSVSTVVTVLIPSREMIPSYAHHLFRSNTFKEEFFRNGHGIHWDLWTTRFSDMKNILVPVPSEETQFQIANFLDAKTKEIEGAKSSIQVQIDHLKEYKDSLIESAVTGKIKVA